MAFTETKPRRPIAAMETGPGPAKYALPGLLGSERTDVRRRSAPSYSMGGRSELKSTARSPGPKYGLPSNTYRQGVAAAPAYTMRPKTADPKGDKTPGPGAYVVARPGTTSKERAAPEFTMRPKHADPKKAKTPSPAEYSLPGQLGSTMPLSGSRTMASYTLSGRSEHGSFLADTRRTPGPGAYKGTGEAVARSAPSYTMRGRYYAPDGAVVSPGPKYAVASPPKEGSSFGIRHTRYMCQPPA